MPLPTRRAGRRAERRSCRFLRRQGWRILARNVRAGRGELDILALEGSVLVVVEVRVRDAGTLAADVSVGRRKEQALRCALRELLRRHPLPRRLPVRFDLLLWDGGRRPAHVRGALRTRPL